MNGMASSFEELSEGLTQKKIQAQLVERRSHEFVGFSHTQPLQRDILDEFDVKETRKTYVVLVFVVSSP